MKCGINIFRFSIFSHRVIFSANIERERERGKKRIEHSVSGKSNQLIRFIIFDIHFDFCYNLHFILFLCGMEERIGNDVHCIQ